MMLEYTEMNDQAEEVVLSVGGSMPAPPTICRAATATRQTDFKHGEAFLREEVTLPLETVELLRNVCRRHGVEPTFRAHSPSLTAAEKLKIVAPARVQKTVTLRLDGVTVLCTAVGNPTLSRPAVREIARRLGLPRSSLKRLHINPTDCDPLHHFEMAPGMVSPFLRPGRDAGVHAVILTDDADQTACEAAPVAVSLSLRWSMMIDGRKFPSVLRDYVCSAYPQVRWLDMRRTLLRQP